MSTDAPQLPTFLTEPLACPPGRCQYPGRPLPPIFTQLETFLRQTFLDRLGDVIYVNGINSASEHLDAIDSTILCLAKRRSPEEVALEIEVKCEELKKLEIGEEGLAEYSSGNERRFRTLLASFVEDAVTAFDDCVRKFNPTSQHCLHSFLDPHFLPVWNVFDATRRVVRAGWKGKVDVSPRALLDELLAAIAEGSIEQSLWSEVDAWEREITRVRSKYLKTITSYFARKMEAAFRREGYHAIIERRGSIIGILSHFLRCNDSPPISYISFRAYADGSPQLAQFFRLLQSPAAIRYPVLSSPHAKANEPFGTFRNMRIEFEHLLIDILDSLLAKSGHRFNILRHSVRHQLRSSTITSRFRSIRATRHNRRRHSPPPSPRTASILPAQSMLEGPT